MKASRLRVFLVLGRVSNLPTVWSNCLAAWLLGGGGSWLRFAGLCLGGMLLYTAGMFLNDAFDEKFDRQFRPERPLPSGAIGHRTVWWAGAGFLALGLLALVPLGLAPLGSGIVLGGIIVLYDAIHKRTAFAPLLMSGCRFLLYLVAGCSAVQGLDAVLVWRALALAAYISGISYLARGESRQGHAPLWAIGLLFIPSVLGVVLKDTKQMPAILVAAILAGWVLWCLRGAWLGPRRPVSQGVAGLLAGIVLVDWLAAVSLTLGATFVSLFFLALVLQRVAPAT